MDVSETETTNVKRRARAYLRDLALRSQTASLKVLRLFLRVAPSKCQRVFALTLPIGALCGLAAVAFHLAIRFAEAHLIEPALAAPAPYWIGLALLVTIEREGVTLAPRGESVLLAGDQVTLFAPPWQLPGAVAILTESPIVAGAQAR